MKSEMRFLNRIVYINSAAIRYSEINLDGNVHLIGTQGVGKSTLLRSILFFYNADTQKLGIPLNKKSFAEHYFGFANSYIVYEIARETGFICVMAFKSQGRISYRFIDSPYNRDFFISPDGKAHESWDKIRSKLDDSTIPYSNKIDRYEEYRNILYGNHQELRKELKRFSILESKQYQNIPRTIQNVFLSSHLEAEFIKQTIIMSLNEDDIKINLDTYNHHLSNFEGQINDINLFRQPAKMEQAESIARKYVEFRRIEKEKKELAFQLAWTLHNNKATEPSLKVELAEKEGKRDEIKELINQINSAADEKRIAINEQTSIIKGKLQTIKEKEKYYRDLNITDLIHRVDKKPALINETSGLEKEKNLLTKEFSKITEKYEALRRELKHQHEAFLQQKKSESLEHKSTYLQEKDAIQEAHILAIQAIQEENTERLKEVHREAVQKLEFTKSLEIKEAEIKHSIFFDKEIKQLEADLLKLLQSYKELVLEKTLTGNQIKTFQQQWESEEKSAVNLFTAEQEKHSLTIQALAQAIDDLERMIKRQASSLHGWLTENMTGWENTIGKVCSEEVLFLEHLQPTRLEGNIQSLYGVQINLDEITIVPKTLADYRDDKKSKEAALSKLKAEFVESQKTHQSNLEKIKKRFQPKIKEQKDKEYEIDYDLLKNEASADEKKVKLSDLLIAAESEKEKALVDILTQIQRAEHEQRSATARELELEKKIKDQLNAQEFLKAEKLKLLTQTNNELERNINNEIDKKNTHHGERLQQIKREEEGDLKSQGANVTRLSVINARLESLEKELKYVEEVATKEVFGYRKDKAELLDHKESLEEQKRELESKLFQEEVKRSRKEEEQAQRVTKIEIKINELGKRLETIANDSLKFEDFKNSDCHLNIGHHLNVVHEDFVSDLAATDIIERLNASYYSGITKSNELKEVVNKFLSNFSDTNIFNFRINLTSYDEYQQFATELSDFISQDRISEFERRVNERYAEIIKMIGKETTEFTSREGEISKVIRDINDDFDKKNFVGIIQKIELRMDASTNPIVEILKLIKKFNDENSGDLGEANLFTSVDRETKNKKAVDFLKQFVKEIERSKRDYISLSDSFELKFRVVENHTDTGWVEKISNVGSEGTDILVKAMINIMLLNVFKEGASRKFKDFKLHCVMDEIGKLHPGNVRGLLKFANDRNILLINGSPTENDAMAFRHIYKLEKDSKAMTKVKRIISKLD